MDEKELFAPVVDEVRNKKDALEALEMIDDFLTEVGQPDATRKALIKNSKVEIDKFEKALKKRKVIQAEMSRNPSISAEGRRILAAFERAKKDRINRKDKEDLIRRMKAEEGKAIQVLKKNAVTERAKRQFEKTFSQKVLDERKRRDMEKAFAASVARVNDIQEAAKKKADELEDESLKPQNAGSFFPTFSAPLPSEEEEEIDEVKLVTNLELLTLQDRVDKIFSDLLDGIEPRALSPKEQLRINELNNKIEDLEDKIKDLNNIRGSRSALSHRDKLKVQLRQLKAERKILQDGIGVLSDINNLFVKQTGELKDIISMPSLNDEQVKKLKDEIQEGSRFIENILQRRITIDSNVLSDLQKTLVDAAKRLSDQKKKQLESQNPKPQQKSNDLFDFFGDIAKGTQDAFNATGQFFGDIGKGLEEAFRPLFNPTVDETADMLVKFALAQQLANQRLNRQ